MSSIIRKNVNNTFEKHYFHQRGSVRLKKFLILAHIISKNGKERGKEKAKVLSRPQQSEIKEET